MKGVVFTGNRKLELQDFPDPTPGNDEVVLEIKASGMCGTDLHLYRSPGGGPGAAKAMGVAVGEGAFIGGHEPCGVVVARGKAVSDRQAMIGARVMQHHYHGCGGCPDCLSGQDDCARFVSERKVPVERLIADRFKLAAAAEAYARFDKQAMGKGMLIPQ
jgi:threonine dehydrogenase-like Zn-dependent dehydrogenase